MILIRVNIGLTLISLRIDWGKNFAAALNEMLTHRADSSPKIKDGLMEIDVSHHGQKTVVKLSDARLDAAMAVRFKDVLKSLVDDGVDHMIFDMSAIKFMDSSGLGVVVAQMKYMGAGRKFEIAGLNPAVEKVFRLTRMDTVFTIYDSAQDAISQDLKAAG